jgi:hypothetical protein
MRANKSSANLPKRQMPTNEESSETHALASDGQTGRVITVLDDEGRDALFLLLSNGISVNLQLRDLMRSEVEL